MHIYIYTYDFQCYPGQLQRTLLPPRFCHPRHANSHISAQSSMYICTILPRVATKGTSATSHLLPRACIFTSLSPRLYIYRLYNIWNIFLYNIQLDMSSTNKSLCCKAFTLLPRVAAKGASATSHLLPRACIFTCLSP